MSALVSSLVSSVSLLTAASVRETTVVFTGCGSIVVGCCSIIGRYPPGERDECVCCPGCPVHPHRTHANGFRQARAPKLLYCPTGSAARRDHGTPRSRPGPPARSASRGEGCGMGCHERAVRPLGSEGRDEDLVDDVDDAVGGGDV